MASQGYQNRRMIRKESQKHLALMLGRTTFGKGIPGRVKGATIPQLKAAAKQLLQGPNAIKYGSGHFEESVE